MKKVFALAAVAAGFAAAPAMAQDNTAPGGLYVGAIGGYEGIDVESSDGSVSADADSAVYGINADGQYYIGARAGVALTPGIAAYGKVGYTALDTKAFTSSGSLDELDDNAGGLRFGGGLQVQLPGPFEGRVEYRRSNYKDVVDGTYGDATTDQVVAGVGVRF